MDNLQEKFTKLKIKSYEHECRNSNSSLDDANNSQGLSDTEETYSDSSEYDFVQCRGPSTQETKNKLAIRKKLNRMIKAKSAREQLKKDLREQMEFINCSIDNMTPNQLLGSQNANLKLDSTTYLENQGLIRIYGQLKSLLNQSNVKGFIDKLNELSNENVLQRVMDWPNFPPCNFFQFLSELSPEWSPKTQNSESPRSNNSSGYSSYSRSSFENRPKSCKSPILFEAARDRKFWAIKAYIKLNGRLDVRDPCTENGETIFFVLAKIDPNCLIDVLRLVVNRKNHNHDELMNALNLVNEKSAETSDRNSFFTNFYDAYIIDSDVRKILKEKNADMESFLHQFDMILKESAKCS